MDRFFGLNVVPPNHGYAQYATEEDIANAKLRKCWDCKTLTGDWVEEERQVYGGGGIVFAGDFQPVPVHANRRDCKKAAEQVVIDWKRANIPFYDVAQEWSEPNG
jgi:hypothetical protein